MTDTLPHSIPHLFNLSPLAVAVLLYLLAVLDCAFANYRCAGGKNALIDKRKYYRSALLKGALLGNVAVMVALALIMLSTLLLSNAAVSEYTHGRSVAAVVPLYVEAGKYALDIYLPYAFVVLAAIGARAIRSADVRSVAQTIVLGPFTFIRPAVAVAGVVYAVWSLQSPVLLLVALPVLFMMLSFEPLMERLSRR